MDGAWQKVGSGKTYNSLSGHNMLVCCETNLILEFVVYSKAYAVC